MCTKKELVEWLEANVPDDVEVRVIDSYSDYNSLDLTDPDSIEIVELPGGKVLFFGC